MAPGTGWGECLGESPRGELVKWVPNVGAPWELRAALPGVVGPFGAAKGPVWVGVIALVVAAMAMDAGCCASDLGWVSICGLGLRVKDGTGRRGRSAPVLQCA